MVEFVLVLPIALTILFGLIAAPFLFYENSSLHDGASAGAREASIETALLIPTGGQYCESGRPATIEQTVARAAPSLPVNMTSLCASSANATQLTQSPNNNSDVNITVTCGGNCSAPLSVTVSLTYNALGIAFPMGLKYSMSASSQVPVLVP